MILSNRHHNATTNTLSPHNMITLAYSPKVIENDKQRILIETEKTQATTNVQSKESEIYDSIGHIGNTGRSATQIEDNNNMLIANLKQRLIDTNNSNLVFLGEYAEQNLKNRNMPYEILRKRKTYLSRKTSEGERTMKIY